MRYLMAQREQMLMMKRDFLEAMVTNDTNGMREVQEAWKGRYPMLGDLSRHVKKSDINAFEMRMEIPRLERQLQQIPESMRDPFREALIMGINEQIPQILGLDPTLLRRGTPRSRNPMRPGFGGREDAYRAAKQQLPTRAAGGIPQNAQPADVLQSRGLSMF